MKKKATKTRIRLLCTACGEELDYFAFAPQANNLAAVKQRADHCSRIGKKNGRMCAKQFIADPNSLSITFAARKKRPTPSKQHISSLKKSIMKKIKQKDG